MKKYLAAIGALLVFIAVFLPLASSNPDGLESVAISLGANEKQPFWNGIMADYSLPSLGDPYTSTLIAGVVGTLMVLAAGLLLGKMFSKNQAKIIKSSPELKDLNN